ncbi:hypothetical protein [Paraburkholderia sp. ZP32-5]|uniref:hypothetical protein n=1 Tax=Paraburkholderia sp. ZP32-5 TaxID=2883245 RepID=UPI001F36F97D|nr:hypothetical protein [Paraburkholderia sp. ZP32-5]
MLRIANEIRLAMETTTYALSDATRALDDLLDGKLSVAAASSARQRRDECMTCNA